VPLVTGLSRAFGTSSQEAAAARHYTRSTIAGWGLDSEDAVLVVSELASNALRYTSGGFELLLERRDHTLLIEVTDWDPTAPTLKHPDTTETNGRGLLLVDQLARSWGSNSSTPASKTVWAELDAKTASG
jgi:anti-sigma regulatory factor (Ser/Thr protein kinase)